MRLSYIFLVYAFYLFINIQINIDKNKKNKKWGTEINTHIKNNFILILTTLFQNGKQWGK